MIFGVVTLPGFKQDALYDPTCPILMQFLQNDHLYGLLMDHKIILLFCFEKGSNFRNFANLEGIYLTIEIVKQDKCPKYNGSSILLYIIVSSNLLYQSKYYVHTCF